MRTQETKSTPFPTPNCFVVRGGPHLCRALAVQYFRFLSGSFTCPSLQHWPHTNFIFRLRGRPLPAIAPNPPTGLTPPPPMQSPPTPPPPIPPTPAGMLPLGWGIWIGCNRQQRSETSTFVSNSKWLHNMIYILKISIAERLNPTFCCFCAFCSSLCQCLLDSCTISS